jgi:ketosteroid isomerase-like protein
MRPEEITIQELYADYLSTFHRLDPGAVAMFYAQPCLFISGRSIVLMQNDEEVAHLFEQIIADLVRQDYDHSMVDNLQVELLSEHLAEVKGLAIRYRKDGRELERAGATYTLRKDANGWKFVTVTTYPAV